MPRKVFWAPDEGQSLVIEVWALDGGLVPGWISGPVLG